jgi:hypothetical protein
MSVTDCRCGQAPRPIINSTIGICKCRHLVYRRVRAFAPPSFAPPSFALNGLFSQQEQQHNVWTASVDRRARRALILDAKRRVGIELVLPAEDVAAAVEAARLAGEDGFANDLEYEHWVAALEA